MLPLMIAGLTLMLGQQAPAQAANPSSASGARQPAATKGDYKIAFWFRREKPLESFQYQAYDLRKGEYTREVDDWLAVMQSKFPGYVAFVRDVDLAHVKGETEPLKVGAIVQEELWAAAAREGIFLNPQARITSGRSQVPITRIERRFPLVPTQPLGSSGFTNLGPPEPSFPVPMPYPRPHP